MDRAQFTTSDSKKLLKYTKKVISVQTKQLTHFLIGASKCDLHNKLLIHVSDRFNIEKHSFIALVKLHKKLEERRGG